MDQPTFLQQVARSLCDHFAEQIVINKGPVAALRSTTGPMRQAVRRYIYAEEEARRVAASIPAGGKS